MLEVGRKSNCNTEEFIYWGQGKYKKKTMEKAFASASVTQRISDCSPICWKKVFSKCKFGDCILLMISNRL